MFEQRAKMLRRSSTEINVKNHCHSKLFMNFLVFTYCQRPGNSAMIPAQAENPIEIIMKPKAIIVDPMTIVAGSRFDDSDITAENFSILFELDFIKSSAPSATKIVPPT